ncbi:MAG: hypothetical protein KC776_37335 [Myxococcales bacterium]|nr:hypothetical protein [Myxococcales bacterium]MCB9579626.1 hypothetical protein [Polyangiaceae bacterium]
MQPPPYGPPPGGYGQPPGGYGQPPGGYAPPGGGFAPPPAGSYGAPGVRPPGGHEWAKQQVMGPAIALMVVSGLAFLWYLFATVMVLFAGGLSVLGAGSGGDAMGGILGGVIGAAMYGVWMIIAGVAFFGALKMKDLKSYPFAMTSAILALLPCTFYICCILGLPFGIWALIVLMKPEVKAEFR